MPEYRFSRFGIHVVFIMFVLKSVFRRDVVVNWTRSSARRASEAWVIDLHRYGVFKCKQMDWPRRRLEDQLLGY